MYSLALAECQKVYAFEFVCALALQYIYVYEDKNACDCGPSAAEDCVNFVIVCIAS